VFLSLYHVKKATPIVKTRKERIMVMDVEVIA